MRNLDKFLSNTCGDGADGRTNVVDGCSTIISKPEASDSARAGVKRMGNVILSAMATD